MRAVEVTARAGPQKAQRRAAHIAKGGASAAGGVSSTGGSTANGATNITGGASSATGGSTAKSSTSATGGLSNATGGSTAKSSTSATGGLSNATGGKTSTGATNATGGTGATGSSPATGGAPATGGSAGCAAVDQGGKALAKLGDKTSVTNDYLNLCTARLLNNNWGSVAIQQSGKSCSAPESVEVNSDGSLGWTFNRGNCADDGSHPDYPELEYGVAPFGSASS